MKGKEKIVRTFQIEELSEEELQRLIRWGEDIVDDMRGDEDDERLLAALRTLMNADSSKTRVASSESDADASESVSERPMPSISMEEMSKATVIDGGSGMIWRERD